MRRALRKIVLLAVLYVGAVASVMGQSQMLLPYNDILFQSTWENPAVRPMHRFSVGLPVLSSVEAGIINNGFRLSDVSEVDEDGWLNIDLGKIPEGLKEGKGYQQYAEIQIDIFHFRMKWRDWFFWLGMRNVSTETFGYERDLFNLVYGGNGAYVGKELNLRRTTVDVKNYMETTFGFSKEFGSKWMLGFRASFLMGVASGLAEFDKFSLIVDGSDEHFYAHTLDVGGSSSASSLYRLRDKEYWKDASTFFNPRNLGFALAGGVSYKPIPNLNLSLAFSDIGMIDWNDSVREYVLSEKRVEVDALLEGKKAFTSESMKTFGKTLREKVGDFSDTTREGSRYTQWLAPKVHFLATYEFARQSVIGASFSGIYQAKTFYPSATVSFMQGVSDIFQVQVSWSYNQYSALNFGAGIVVCPGPVQIYAVTDNFLAFIKPTMAKATNLRVGINLVFERLNNHHSLTYDR